MSLTQIQFHIIPHELLISTTVDLQMLSLFSFSGHQGSEVSGSGDDGEDMEGEGEEPSAQVTVM